MIEKTGDRTVVAPDRKPSFVDQSLIAEIDRATWTWAKTYAEFAPHWYIVKDKHPGLFGGYPGPLMLKVRSTSFGILRRLTDT